MQSQVLYIGNLEMHSKTKPMELRGVNVEGVHLLGREVRVMVLV
jgi:hypothetical protein